MESFDEQQASDTHVIVVCPNCSQTLRAPKTQGKLRLTCPKCRHDWLWSPGATITIQIERIKEKIEIASQLLRAEIQASEFYPSTFPERDAFNFNPPLSSLQIDAWETKYNTSLPQEYRSFLEQIGNGGGLLPGGTMLRLEDWASGLNFEDEDKALIAPSQPCLLLEECQSDAAWQQWLVESVGEDWEHKSEQELWAPEFGTIAVCHDSCGSSGHLILNGALKGRICYFIGWGSPIFEPSATFLDWYESDLDANWLI